MDNVKLAFVVGLLAGALGGFVAMQFAPSSTTGSSFDGDTDTSDIVLRLDRIEARLDRPAMRSSPQLTGGGEGRASASTGIAAGSDLDALVTALEERLKPTLQESVKTSVNEALSERSGEIYAEAMPAKKKMTLAEAAAELELTADEEEAVRRIARETSEEFLKVVAGKDASVDDIRREFEEAREDPKKRAALTTKYMGKVMANLGGLMAVGMTHEQKMREALGAEKARRLDDEYDVTDLDPLGLEAVFDFD